MISHDLAADGSSLSCPRRGIAQRLRSGRMPDLLRLVVIVAVVGDSHDSFDDDHVLC
jgi:hypothetical protein